MITCRPMKYSVCSWLFPLLCSFPSVAETSSHFDRLKLVPPVDNHVNDSPGYSQAFSWFTRVTELPEKSQPFSASWVEQLKKKYNECIEQPRISLESTLLSFFNQQFVTLIHGGKIEAVRALDWTLTVQTATHLLSQKSFKQTCNSISNCSKALAVCKIEPSGKNLVKASAILLSYYGIYKCRNPNIWFLLNELNHGKLNEQGLNPALLPFVAKIASSPAFELTPYTPLELLFEQYSSNKATRPWLAYQLSISDLHSTRDAENLWNNVAISILNSGKTGSLLEQHLPSNLRGKFSYHPNRLSIQHGYIPNQTSLYLTFITGQVVRVPDDMIVLEHLVSYPSEMLVKLGSILRLLQDYADYHDLAKAQMRLPFLPLNFLFIDGILDLGSIMASKLVSDLQAFNYLNKVLRQVKVTPEMFAVAASEQPIFYFDQRSFQLRKKQYLVDILMRLIPDHVAKSSLFPSNYNGVLVFKNRSFGVSLGDIDQLLAVYIKELRELIEPVHANITNQVKQAAINAILTRSSTSSSSRAFLRHKLAWILIEFKEECYFNRLVGLFRLPRSSFQFSLEILQNLDYNLPVADQIVLRAFQPTISKLLLNSLLYMKQSFDMVNVFTVSARFASYCDDGIMRAVAWWLIGTFQYKFPRGHVKSLAGLRELSGAIKSLAGGNGSALADILDVETIPYEMIMLLVVKTLTRNVFFPARLIQYFIKFRSSSDQFDWNRYLVNLGLDIAIPSAQQAVALFIKNNLADFATDKYLESFESVLRSIVTTSVGANTMKISVFQKSQVGPSQFITDWILEQTLVKISTLGFSQTLFLPVLFDSRVHRRAILSHILSLHDIPVVILPKERCLNSLDLAMCYSDPLHCPAVRIYGVQLHEFNLSTLKDFQKSFYPRTVDQATITDHRPFISLMLKDGLTQDWPLENSPINEMYTAAFLHPRLLAQHTWLQQFLKIWDNFELPDVFSLVARGVLLKDNIDLDWNTALNKIDLAVNELILTHKVRTAYIESFFKIRDSIFNH